MRRSLVVVLVAVALVTLVLVGCQDLQTPGPDTSTRLSTTTVPAQVVTTQRDLVRVPSYKDFESTYTGDDWGQVLAAWQAAVEEGFSQAGLVADIELVAPGDTEYQDPEAGTMVPRGTVVHIRVAVYD